MTANVHVNLVLVSIAQQLIDLEPLSQRQPYITNHHSIMSHQPTNTTNHTHVDQTAFPFHPNIMTRPVKSPNRLQQTSSQLEYDHQQATLEAAKRRRAKIAEGRGVKIFGTEEQKKALQYVPHPLSLFTD